VAKGSDLATTTFTVATETHIHYAGIILHKKSINLVDKYST